MYKFVVGWIWRYVFQDYEMLTSPLKTIIVVADNKRSFPKNLHSKETVNERDNWKLTNRNSSIVPGKLNEDPGWMWCKTIKSVLRKSLRYQIPRVGEI